MNQALQNAISQVADWKNKTAAELRTAIAEIQRTPRRPSERVYSVAGIAKEFGVPAAETIYAALQAAGMNAIAARFAAAGLDTTDPQWLANAEALIAGGALNAISAGNQQGLKWIGYNSAALYAEATTDQEVTDAKQTLLNIEAADTVRAEIENDYINPALASGAQTEAELRAAIKAGL